MKKQENPQLKSMRRTIRKEYSDLSLGQAVNLREHLAIKPEEFYKQGSDPIREIKLKVLTSIVDSYADTFVHAIRSLGNTYSPQPNELDEISTSMGANKR